MGESDLSAGFIVSNLNEGVLDQCINQKSYDPLYFTYRLTLLSREYM